MLLTVDQFLLKIQTDINQLPVKDHRILQSLLKQLSHGIFLTENQSKLLIKILNSNRNQVRKIDSSISEVLKNNSWSKPFRVIQKIRKIYIDKENIDQIKIDFTYDKEIKNRLLAMNSLFYGTLSLSGKSYAIPLTEKNIYLLVKEFIDLDFEIDEKILNFYHEIDKIMESPPIEFDVFSPSNEKFLKIIKDDIGDIDLKNLNFIHDRKIRYQYKISEKIHEKSLENAVVQRNKNKIFVDDKFFSLDELLDVLKNLKRFPLLLIFDGHDPKLDKKMLDLVNLSLTKTKINGNFGVYYRFDKTAEGAEFNSTIAKFNYNQKLAGDTKIVGIANNKLPKFMIKMNWKPQAIISFTPVFKNNKSSAYFSDVDLIIYYGNKQPLSGDIDAVM